MTAVSLDLPEMRGNSRSSMANNSTATGPERSAPELAHSSAMASDIVLDGPERRYGLDHGTGKGRAIAGMHIEELAPGVWPAPRPG